MIFTLLSSYQANFAQLTLPEFTGFLAMISAMLGGFYALIKSMQKTAQADRDADRKERKAFERAISKMAASSERVADTNKQIADSVDRQASESAQRNGHLGELILEQGNLSKKLNEDAVKKIIKSFQHIGVQEVDQQNVHTKTNE